MQRNIIQTFGILLLISFGHTSSHASTDTLQKSRYVSVKVGATKAEVDLLQSVIHVNIPSEIKTVGKALVYLVKPYGLKLLNAEPLFYEHYLLFTLVLPEPHRDFGPITLHDALAVIGGESLSMNVNPVKRTVSFTLKPEYKKYISEVDVLHAKQVWNDANTVSSQTYGPVSKGESLSSIAMAMGYEGMTLNQRMVSIFQANSESFYSNNMNLIRQGTILNMPLVDLSLVVSTSKADSLVENHHNQWVAMEVAQ